MTSYDWFWLLGVEFLREEKQEFLLRERNSNNKILRVIGLVENLSSIFF